MEKIALEEWENCGQEIIDLAYSHSAEIDWYLDKMKTDPVKEQYDSLGKSGFLYPIVARDLEGSVIGYSLYFVLPSMHYRGHVFAQNDVYYIAPEYRKRGLGAELLNYSEIVMRTIGVSMIDVVMKSNHTFHTLAEHCGYDLMEHKYTKWIGD